jgi:hypothetical protein
MSLTVLVHLLNEEPLLAEVESMPEPSDQVLILSNVRRRDGQEVSFLLPDAGAVIFPWARIQCVEVMSSESEEQVVSFIRE